MLRGRGGDARKPPAIVFQDCWPGCGLGSNMQYASAAVEAFSTFTTGAVKGFLKGPPAMYDPTVHTMRGWQKKFGQIWLKEGFWSAYNNLRMSTVHRTGGTLMGSDHLGNNYFENRDAPYGERHWLHGSSRVPGATPPPPAARPCSCLVADGQHHPAAHLPAGPACGRPSSCGQTQTSAAEHRRGPVWPPTVSIARSPRPPAGPACGRRSRRAAERRRYPNNRAYFFKP